MPGKRTISPFIYVGQLDYLLRIPYTHIYDKEQTYYSKYLLKKDYTLEQVKEMRLKLIIEMEQDGRRMTDCQYKRGRLITSSSIRLT